MRPGIMVFEKMMGNDVIEREENCYYGCRMDNETIACNAQPVKACRRIGVFFLCRLKIGKGTKQRANKRENYKEMT